MKIAIVGRGQFDWAINDRRLFFMCPACANEPPFPSQQDRGIHVIGKHSFNGDFENPSLSPSILYQYHRPDGDFVCHSFVTDGKISYCSDCSHSMSGMTVELPEIPDNEDGLG
jgi:hypothetical protein